MGSQPIFKPVKLRWLRCVSMQFAGLLTRPVAMLFARDCARTIPAPPEAVARFTRIVPQDAPAEQDSVRGSLNEPLQARFHCRGAQPIKLIVLSSLAVFGAAQPAFAGSCDTANTYSFLYANQPAATLAYGSTYNYTATNGGGTTRSFSVAIAQNGLTSTTAGGVQMPAIGTLITGPDATKRDLVLGGAFGTRTTSLTGTTNVVSVTFTFAQPIRDFAMTAHDIDFTSDQFRDWVQVTGSDGAATYNPVITTPWSTGNDGVLPHTDANSSLTVGATTSPLNLSVAQTGGTSASNNNSDTGTFYASFAQPVTSVTFKYGNYPLTSGEKNTGQQATGIAGISFCPMPVLTVAKTSAPYDTTGPTRFAAPGSDIAYSLIVTNSGGSTVDLNSLILTDALPAGVTFYNADFNASSPGMGPFELTGTSTVTLPASGITYSNTTTAPYTYSPAAGYDANVKAISLIPSGTMAANSTLTIRFRAKIK